MVCLECNSKLNGRVDKKFCSDACRNSFNNKLNSDSTAIVRNTNNALRKNRRILASLFNPNKEYTVVKLSQLAILGFNFQLITKYHQTKNANQYFYVYDYGYRKLEEEKYLIVKQDNELSVETVSQS